MSQSGETESEVKNLAARYLAGATVYELAEEFEVSRSTVSERLKRIGVTLRLHLPSIDIIDEMVRLYKSGVSLLDIGKRYGFAAGTVRRHLLTRGVSTRNTHGRERS